MILTTVRERRSEDQSGTVATSLVKVTTGPREVV